MINYLLVGILIILVIFALRKCIKDMKSGSCCGGLSCASCKSRNGCKDDACKIGKEDVIKASAETGIQSKE